MATIVDDSNSNLVWSGNSWRTEHSDDFMTGRYFNSTFHSSTISGDSCLIAWEGTDIYVYGARRKNHGLYGVVIDNGDIQYFSGYSLEGQFQATLFATNGLAQGSHTLKISNENQRNKDQYPDYVWLDIDSIAFSGILINAASSDSGSSSSALASSFSSSESATEFTDITSGVYTETGSSASIISTASDTVSSSSQSRLLPPIPSTTISPSATANNSGESSDRKTLTLAISIPVIVISSIVIFVFLGIYTHRRRKTKYERQYDNGYSGYMEEPQSSWRQ